MTGLSRPLFGVFDVPRPARRTQAERRIRSEKKINKKYKVFPLSRSQNGISWNEFSEPFPMGLLLVQQSFGQYAYFPRYFIVWRVNWLIWPGEFEILFGWSQQDFSECKPSIHHEIITIRFIPEESTNWKQIIRFEPQSHSIESNSRNETLFETNKSLSRNLIQTSEWSRWQEEEEKEEEKRRKKINHFELKWIIF